MQLKRRFHLCAFLCALLQPAVLSAQSAQVHAGDVLQLKFWPDQTLSGEFPVLSSGRVSVPLIGEVTAAGVAFEDVIRSLQNTYRETTQNGVVTGTLLYRISVLGSVPRPGVYPSEYGRTLFDVISAAGGFSPNADLSKVQIVRGSGTIAVDATTVYANGAGALLVPIQSGDRVVVPEKKSSRLSTQLALTLLQTAAVITSIILQVR